MQITLLPPLLPSDGVVSVPASGHAFTPGARVLATVLEAGLGGETLLAFGGRQIPTGTSLPYPPGTTLRLEVVEGGPRPLLRLVSTGAEPPADAADGAAVVPGPPVSSATYGLAAAVLAARDGPDVRSAAAAVLQWIPLLVSSGVISAEHGKALLKALAPVPVHAHPNASPDAAPATEMAARAIAERVADGGLLLERRLADVVRQGHVQARAVAANDLRARLALAAHVLADAPPALEGARQAVTRLQEALLAEQARAAAHLAREGVVDVRVPLQVDGSEAELRLRLRIERDPDGSAADQVTAPWRQVRLDLALDGLGRVQVRLGVQAGHVRAEFLAEHPAAADRLEAGLADLSMALEAAGFAQVLSRVIVDPVRACELDVLPDLPPQRAILDTRA
jgi:hypothetical protein